VAGDGMLFEWDGEADGAAEGARAADDEASTCTRGVTPRLGVTVGVLPTGLELLHATAAEAVGLRVATGSSAPPRGAACVSIAELLDARTI